MLGTVIKLRIFKVLPGMLVREEMQGGDVSTSSPMSRQISIG